MPENIVVGAGLAGLVAAINLAREGRDVLVLEKESRIGGTSLYHPSPEGTPLDLAKLEQYTGIDFSPEAAGTAVAPFQKAAACAYGQFVEIDLSGSYMIERGPRSTSLDTYLYSLALEAGVKFEFDHPVMSNDDVACLPPDTIIATGLYFEGFDATRVPYLTSFHFIARKTIEDTGVNHVTLYHGEFTSDYAYTSSINGIQFAHVFQRLPIGKKTLWTFEELIDEFEDIHFNSWAHFTFPVPAATIRNPRLFAGDKILAGTLSGCMESYMFFGLHGAMVSGKIAAMAVTDKAGALEEFKRATSLFPIAYIVKKMSGLMPHALMRRAMPLGLKRTAGLPIVPKAVKSIMPGARNMK
jgi:flavin-dependent dehydrogenase